MKFANRISKLWKAAASAGGSYSLPLQNVHLDVAKKLLVATDGHVIAVVDAADLIEDGEQDFDIPADALKFASTLLAGKQNRVIPMDKVTIVGRGECVAVTLNGRDQRFYYPKTGAFPKWEAVTVETTSEYRSITLNPALLVQIADALAGKAKPDCVTLYAKGAEDPIIVASRVGDGENYAMLMPMRNAIAAPKLFWKNRTAKKGV